MSHIDLSNSRKILPHLTREEHFELQQLMASDSAIWSPLPGPQDMAYRSMADVLGYGGAAGGGKTDLGCGKTLTQHTRSAIFRREGTEMNAIVDRFEAIVGSRKGYAASPYRVWKNPVPNVQIDFGSCPNPGDERKHQGRPKDFLFLDEVTHFMYQQAMYLMGWVRTPDPNQRTQTLMTFNPPEDSEGFWVVDYFAPWLDESYPLPAEYGELRYFITVGSEQVEVEDGEQVKHRGETYIPQSRTFILSKVTDNPYYADTGYMAQLQAMPEEMRERLLYANFKAAWKDNPQQVCPSQWVQDAMDRWVHMDRKPEMMALGVDVARGGKDRTVIARRHDGYWFDKPISYPGKDTPDGPIVAGHVVTAMRDGAGINIDAIGVGSSPYDFLKEAKLPVNAIMAGNACPYMDRTGIFSFNNFRSYMHWHFRELLDPQNNIGMALPPDRNLKKELTTAQWRAPGRVVQVESRDEIIKRLGVSNDLAVAYVQAALEAPKLKHMPGHGTQKAKLKAKGHDPYAFLNKR